MMRLYRNGWAAGMLLVLFSWIGTLAQDAQWRGPDRDGIFPDTMLLKEWPEEGPAVLFVTEGIG